MSYRKSKLKRKILLFEAAAKLNAASRQGLENALAQEMHLVCAVEKRIQSQCQTKAKFVEQARIAGLNINTASLIRKQCIRQLVEFQSSCLQLSAESVAQADKLKLELNNALQRKRLHRDQLLKCDRRGEILEDRARSCCNLIALAEAARENADAEELVAGSWRAAYRPSVAY